MSVEKRNDGYSVRWRDASGRNCSKQVKLWRDAIRLDSEKKRMKVMGELVAHERGDITLIDFWEIYSRDYLDSHITPRTKRGYMNAWKNHIKPTFGSKKLKAIERRDVAVFIAAQSKKLKPATVRAHLMVIQGALQRAVEWGYLAANPALGTKRPPLHDRREGRALNTHELAALITELPDLRSKTLVRFLADTGLRPGEARALRWRDVRAGYIVVDKAVSEDTIGPTKNHQKRSVVLRDPARKALLEWKMSLGTPNPEDFLFGGRRNRKQVWTDNGYRLWFKQVFKPATERAGIVGIRVYDLRHTFVSHLIADGKDIYWIAKQAGHAAEMALSTYGHLIYEKSESVRDVCAEDMCLLDAISENT